VQIDTAFDIESPAIRVPWKTTVDGLLRLLEIAPPRAVTRNYYTLPVQVLGGLKCMLGFHFRNDGQLGELEFFRTAYPDQESSFHEFQSHFESTFGAPTRTAPGDEGFPSHEWHLAGATIVHYILYRFGPEEHMRIRRAA